MQNVVRSLHVFEAVAEHQPVRVGELAEILGLPKTSVQRCLGALADAGWIQVTNAAAGVTCWSLTSKAVNVGRKASRELDLRDAAVQPMQRLRDETGETTYLSVADGPHGPVLIERMDSTHQVRTFHHLGRGGPYHLTSIGLAILAHLPTNLVDESLAAPLERRTDRTVVDPDKIRAELELIRARGYAVNVGKSQDDVCGIGAAILNPHGGVAAGVSISMPQSRFDADRVPEWGELVHKTASEVAANLRG